MSAKYQAICSSLYVANTYHDTITFPNILVTKVTEIYWYNTVSPYGTDLSPPNIIWIYPERPFGIAPVDHENTTDNGKSLTNLTTTNEKHLKMFLPNKGG